MLPYSFAPATTIKSSEVNENLRLLSHSGLIAMWPSDSIPDGWLLCDGSSLLRSTYPDLFAAIGTVFGAADGTHFNVPNLKGRVVVGKDGSQTEFDAMGETGGEKTHLLTSAESGLQAHNHTQDEHTHGQNVTTSNNNASPYYPTVSARGSVLNLPGSGQTQAAQPAIQNSAALNATTAHNNLQPYIVLNYIVKI